MVGLLNAKAIGQWEETMRATSGFLSIGLMALAAFSSDAGAQNVAQSVAGPGHSIGEASAFTPGPVAGGFDLPNGWRITPAGEQVAETGDLILNMTPSPDGKVLVAMNSGYQPHALTVIDVKTRKVIQTIPVLSAWLGFAWAPDGSTLYVSGGNTTGDKQQNRPTMAPIAGPDDPPAAKDPTIAPVYAIPYRNGRLIDTEARVFNSPLSGPQTYWSGLARHPTKPLLYAAMRGVDSRLSTVVVFDATTRALVKQIPVGVSPYDVLLNKDGSRLYVSNWSSGNVSIIDTATDKVIGTVAVGDNPNDMILSDDGRLFVACANDNSVAVIDVKAMRAIETINTSLTPLAPVGSTPNALEIDPKQKLLFVANADNNNVAVVDIADRKQSDVAGFIPTGWYPSALALAEKGAALYVGSSKGQAAYADLYGPNSPLRSAEHPGVSIKTLQKASVERIPLGDLKARLRGYTRQVYANTPYNDTLLTKARPSGVPSIIPDTVGVGSPIKHVIYIIKENRTYDQVLGDLPNTNGDPRLAIFGGKVTPNHHALALQFVALDNIYCDGEVSQDGHHWSTGAYATDFNEKTWPANYGGHSASADAPAKYVSNGYLWDLAKRFNLTYRSYGEFAQKKDGGIEMEARAGIFNLQGHVSKEYGGFGGRDIDNAAVFIREFEQFERNFDSTDPAKRLPNVTIMALGEDHTRGTAPGAYTPSAAVASNDYAMGLIIERVSHSKYWAETAIFVIEDDAQDGADHVDARRTVAFAVSPYIHRGKVDSTHYTTVSLLRTIELLLGLPPMSQYDAAATPLYAAFSDKPDLTPYRVIPPQINIYERNLPTAYGAAESARMNFAEEDRAPMGRLNEIIWKSIKGSASDMPASVHRYKPLLDAGYQLPPQKDD
jgi:YVTN family beta-propeller protein